MARSLRPGGVLVLDFLNAVVVERDLVAHEIVERDDGALSLAPME